MRQSHRVLSLSICMILSITGLATAASSADVCWKPTELEKRFASKVNFKRSRLSIGKLTLDPELSKVSRVHSKEMQRRGSAFHSTMDQLSSRVTNWIVLAENVGAAPTVKRLWRRMMDSALHESNVVNREFVYMGVGVIEDGRMKYLTITFEGRKNPGTSLEMPSC